MQGVASRACGVIGGAPDGASGGGGGGRVIESKTMNEMDVSQDGSET